MAKEPGYQKRFYKKYYPSVVMATEGTGLHPEAVIAQMALESGWGTSGLTTRDNNFFGIKSHGKAGGKTWDTEEVRDGKRGSEKASFRKYEDAEDSIRDYVDFIQTNPRYKKAGVFDAKTPEEQAEAFQKSGYATGSNYGNKIKTTINSNQKYLDTIPEHQLYLKSNTNPNLPRSEGSAEQVSSQTRTQQDEQRRRNILNPDAAEADRENANESLQRKNQVEIIKRGNKEYVVDQVSGDMYQSPSGSDEFTEEDLDYIMAQKDSLDAVNFDNFNQVEPEEAAKIIEPGEEDDEGHDAKLTETYSGPHRERNPKTGEYFDQDWNREKKRRNADRQLPPENEDRLTDDQKRILNAVSGNKTRGGLAGGSTDGGVRQPKEFKPNINDLTKPSGAENIDADSVGDIDDTAAINARLKENRSLLENLENKKVFQPDLPEAEGNDVAGNIADLGRAVVGVAGATEELPRYTPSRIFSTATQESEDRRNMGLSQEEIGLRKQLQDRGYGYDVKNIQRMSGGSSGVALGNLGRATRQYADESAATAGMDEAVRRQNRDQFYKQADKAENVNRQIFEDDLNQAMLNKQSAAGLVSDSLSNIKDRTQFQKTYGEGSQYSALFNETIGGMQEDRAFLREANEDRRVGGIASLTRTIEEDEALLSGRNQPDTGIVNPPAESPVPETQRTQPTPEQDTQWGNVDATPEEEAEILNELREDVPPENAEAPVAEETPAPEATPKGDILEDFQSANPKGLAGAEEMSQFFQDNPQYEYEDLQNMLKEEGIDIPDNTEENWREFNSTFDFYDDADQEKARKIEDILSGKTASKTPANASGIAQGEWDFLDNLDKTGLSDANVKMIKVAMGDIDMSDPDTLKEIKNLITTLGGKIPSAKK